MKTIYLDHASTTKLNRNAFEKMIPYLTEYYGNASSLHSLGRKAIEGVDNARDIISKIINSNRDEIYFTSGGTEGDNLALKGIARANISRGNHIVVTNIEHLAVISTCKELEKEGFIVTYISPDENGEIAPEVFGNVINDKTILTSCMFANNEIGTIEPIARLAKISKEKGAYFFTDAVQAIGSIRIDVKKLGIDALSASSHKFCGPKGVGFLYVNSKIKFNSIISGGHQEKQKRAGTYNVAGIVGMAEALNNITANMDKTNKYIKEIRDYFIKEVCLNFPFAKVNCSTNKLVNNASVTFSGVYGENLLAFLDLNGICASLGAACSAGAIEPSYVLKNIGLNENDVKSTIRFTFGTDNTMEDVDYVINIIKAFIK